MERRHDLGDLLRGTSEFGGALQLPRAADRAFWDVLDADLRAHLILQGERWMAEAWTPLYATDYLAFTRTGDRMQFEDHYFPRRTKLATLVVAECVEYQGRFLDEIVNGLYLMLGEASWCNPAHNSYVRDTPQLPLPSTRRQIIDLFDAETAAIVGLAEWVLRPELEAVSPFIGETVTDAIKARILDPFLTEYFWWMGLREDHVNNWTPWIVQNVLLALCSRQEQDVPAHIRTKVAAASATYLDRFLDDYGEDGCCCEGAQYYSHAGLCLYGALRILNDISGGVMLPAFRQPKVAAIASYIMKVHVTGTTYLNYADCSANAGRRSAREFGFARATGNTAMMAYVAQDYREQDWSDRLLSEEWSLYYRLLQVMDHQAMMDYPAAQPYTEGTYFASTGLMVARGEHLLLAAKGGHNGESHNHNDVGSVIVYKDTQPFLIDLGVETYCRKTFSPQRYEIWTMQSQYHNLPSFYDAADPDHWIMQRDGEQYAATDVICTVGDRKGSMSMDLAGPYDDARIRHYIRHAALTPDGRIVIEDHADADLAFVLSLMFYEEPEILAGQDQSNGAGQGAADVASVCAARGEIVIRVGALGEIRVQGAARACKEVCPITDERLRTAWDHDCYRVLLYAAGADLRLELQ